ncbi:MAG: radical SAM protein [Sneathiellales bacterium]|nr:radical SAM protein [Sneathiellales bacterium]
MSILVDEQEGLFVTQALEVHVVHTCNLHCDGCKHYSNYNHSGRLDPATYRDWITGWAKKIKPQKMRLLGGEPTLHPDLISFLYITREVWPDTSIFITTNGYFLDRHPLLFEAMKDTNARLSMSIHSNDLAYRAKTDPIRAAIRKHREESGIDLMETDVTEVWTKNYHGTGATMKPYQDGAPQESWKHCSAKNCMQLHENRLWKCGPLAYLEMQLEKFDLLDDPDWHPYLNYQSLGLEASPEEMRAFLSKGPESACAMCPAAPPHIKDKTTDWKQSFNSKTKTSGSKAA